MNEISNSYNAPAFTANAKFSRGFKKQIIDYVETNKQEILANHWKSVIPANYIKTDGTFNSDKFFRHLKEDIADDTQDEKGTYIFDKAKSYMGRLFSSVKYFDENGKELVEKRYRFNPTHFLKRQRSYNNRPNVFEFFTTHIDFRLLGKNKAKQAAFFKDQSNLF